MQLQSKRLWPEYIEFLDVIHRHFYLLISMFRRMDLSPSSGKIRLSSSKSVEPAPISGYQSQNHATTDGQSFSVSWCEAASGAHDHILNTVWQYHLVFVRRPLWPEVGSFLYQSSSAVIRHYVHEVFIFYMFDIVFMYIQSIKGYYQPRLRTEKYA